jgi:hypothetical protein
MDFELFYCIRGSIHIGRASGTGFAPCIFEGRNGKRLFGRKMAIEAAFLQADWLDNVLHGASLEALPIEEGGSLSDDPFSCFRSFSHIDPNSPTTIV